MHKSFIAIAFLLLTGCATGTLNDLQEKGYQQSDELPVNYQAAYRNLRQQIQKCRGLDEKITNRSRIDHELYTDIEEAHFTFVLTSAFGPGAPTTDVRFKAIDDEKTLMTMSTKYKSHMNARYEKYKAWASGNFVPCR